MLTESQLQLPLTVDNPWSHAYFVPHSGVSEALAVLRGAILTPEHFTFYRLAGPRGVGKTHLIELLRQEVAASGAISFAAFDEDADWNADDTVRRFIDAYESFKAQGGLLLVAGETPGNPHLASRFSLAQPLALKFPDEGELRPLVAAIMERRGLRFADAQLEYLLDRLPANPLSLSDIFAKIDRLSLSRGTQPNRSVFRAVLNKENSKEG